jgi:hypothetical protein
MELKLVREILTDESTVGSLYVDGVFECYTLEDRVRPVKVKGFTAIFPGHHEVVITFSERFRKPLPLLLNVPLFDGVRIHPGNTAKDTEGCVLVGTGKQANMITGSQLAFQKLFAKLLDAAQKEKIFIEIVAAGSAAPVATPSTVTASAETPPPATPTSPEPLGVPA